MGGATFIIVEIDFMLLEIVFKFTENVFVICEIDFMVHNSNHGCQFKIVAALFP